MANVLTNLIDEINGIGNTQQDVHAVATIAQDPQVQQGVKLAVDAAAIAVLCQVVSAVSVAGLFYIAWKDHERKRGR